MIAVASTDMDIDHAINLLSWLYHIATTRIVTIPVSEKSLDGSVKRGLCDHVANAWDHIPCSIIHRTASGKMSREVPLSCNIVRYY